MKHDGPEYEKEWKKREHLQREVLKYLKERGGIHYDAAYVSLDPHRTASIQTVLRDLLTYGLISIDQDKTVTITDAGLQTLADQP